MGTNSDHHHAYYRESNWKSLWHTFQILVVVPEFSQGLEVVERVDSTAFSLRRTYVCR